MRNIYRKAESIGRALGSRFWFETGDVDFFTYVDECRAFALTSAITLGAPSLETFLEAFDGGLHAGYLLGGE